MKAVRTAVIVLNWNNASDTAACLESLFKSNVAILPIVVDNASTKPGFDDLATRFPEAIYLRNQENLGFGRGNNVGLKWALANTSAEYLLILNNDALVKSGTIEILESFLDHNKQVSVATPQIVFADEPTLVWYGGGDVNWWRGSATVYNWRQHVNLNSSPQAITFASGCAIMIRRGALKEVGGFDPKYFMYEEDVDFSLRLAQSGHTIFYVPQAIVLHRVQGSQRNDDDQFFTLLSPHNPRLPFLIYHIIQNRFLNMYKYAHGWQRIAFLFFFPTYVVSKALQYLIYGRWDAVRAMVKGYLSYRKLRKAFYVDEINSV